MSSVSSLRVSYLFFFIFSSSPPQTLPSFPTRRSSDLGAGQPPGELRLQRDRGELEAEQVVRVAGDPEPLAEHREPGQLPTGQDRKSTRLNSSHLVISYAVFCLKKKKRKHFTSMRQYIR